jgi:hypothetical protein
VLEVGLESVAQNMKLLLTRRFVLDVSTNLFSYVGGFLCYVIVGMAMKWGNALNDVFSIVLFCLFFFILHVSGF